MYNFHKQDFPHVLSSSTFVQLVSISLINVAKQLYLVRFQRNYVSYKFCLTSPNSRQNNSDPPSPLLKCFVFMMRVCTCLYRKSRHTQYKVLHSLGIFQPWFTFRGLSKLLFVYNCRFEDVSFICYRDSIPWCWFLQVWPWWANETGTAGAVKSDQTTGIV